MFDHIPGFFSAEKFICYQSGISDNSGIDVWVNEANDFAVLSEITEVDYSNYIPRGDQNYLVKLTNLHKQAENRYTKIKHYFDKNDISVLEVGAAEGAFLKVVRDEFESMELIAIEPDKNTLDERRKIADISDFDSIDEFNKTNKKVDRVVLFHVLEHILEPEKFILSMSDILKNDGLLIVEVPALTDPLLSLYKSDAYSKFYFQSQHPFVYSAASVKRMFEFCGYNTVEVIPFQRYGISNHLAWLSSGNPGGNAQFAEIFAGSEESYKESLEKSGFTDSVIWVGRKNV